MASIIKRKKAYSVVYNYVDENGEDVTKKVPVEIQDYGMIYDNLYEVIFNHGEKVVADEEVLEVLRILEQATEVAKEAK